MTAAGFSLNIFIFFLHKAGGMTEVIQ